MQVRDLIEGLQKQDQHAEVLVEVLQTDVKENMEEDGSCLVKAESVGRENSWRVSAVKVSTR